MSTVNVKEIASIGLDGVELPYGAQNMKVTKKPFYKYSGGAINTNTTIEETENALSLQDVTISEGYEVDVQGEWVILS